MKIAMLYPLDPPFGPDTHNQVGLGGSENGFVRTIEYLVKRGDEVWVFNRWPVSIDAGNLHWRHIDQFQRQTAYDVVYSLRSPEKFVEGVNARLRVLFLADTESRGLGTIVREGKLDLIMAVSAWQKEKIAQEEHIHDDYWMVTSNGIASMNEVTTWRPEDDLITCIYMATPERGLMNLLAVWPEIHRQVPESRLLLYSSYMGWGVPQDQNEEMCRELYAQIAGLAPLGVENRKHGNAEEIRKALMLSDLYLYPTDFYETCCMSVLEAMFVGVVPIVTRRAALMQHVTNGLTGISIAPIGASTKRYQQQFIAETVALMRDKYMRGKMSMFAHDYADQYKYDKLVPAWVAEWESRLG